MKEKLARLLIQVAVYCLKHPDEVIKIVKSVLKDKIDKQLGQ